MSKRFAKASVKTISYQHDHDDQRDCFLSMAAKTNFCFGPLLNAYHRRLCCIIRDLYNDYNKFVFSFYH